MSARRLFALRLAAVAFTLGVAAAASPLHAQTCTVPGTHATIQEAADDPTCATIVLSAQTYPESVVIRRSLTLAGPGTGGAVVQGLVLIAGATTEATLSDLRVENGCRPDALRTASGARVTGTNLQVERSESLPCPLTADAIFVDGFDSGNTSAWSDTIP
jgi:hypothetical protein